MAITFLFSLSLLFIFLFSLSQLQLTLSFLLKKKHQKKQDRILDKNFIPHVTIQLPLFNEKLVVNRLMDAVAQIQWPSEKLEIQILDDSTDETSSLLLKKIEELRPHKLDIQLLHRENRKGFKAGALQQGLKVAKGEFIALFDADFIPPSDFLIKTIPGFAHPSVGMIQTRWGHLNEHYSWLTALQAFALDAHFFIEQQARQSSGSFINFNGTCGIWRKRCIEDAGGWSADTLTEDLDLSYRAQLKGWKFQYAGDLSTPGELPFMMQAIKTQQYRWNKGGAETARKLLGKVLRSSISLKKKGHAFFHLLNSSVFFFLLLAALLSVPMVFIKTRIPFLEYLFQAGILFLTGFFSIAFFYWVSVKESQKKNPLLYFLKRFPPFLVISMGLSYHNGMAVLEGWLNKKTPFVRTPKFNIQKKSDSWKNNPYFKASFTFNTFMEGLLLLYFAFGLVSGILLHEKSLLFFHILLTLGYGMVFFLSLFPLTLVLNKNNPNLILS